MRKNPDSRQRIIHFELTTSKQQFLILQSLTYAASKLWNTANYEIKSWTEGSGLPRPNWYSQKKSLKGSFWYKNLPSQTAQEVLKQLHEGWQSFYKLKNTGGIQNPQPPRYKHSNFSIRYLNKGFVVSESNIRLTIPKNQKKYLEQKYGSCPEFLYIQIPKKYKCIKGNIKVIEIIPVPKSNRYRISIIIELPKVPVEKKNDVYMAIDLGINNLITCHTSKGSNMILSGRQLLSLNRYYDKEISHYQSIAYAQQSAAGVKYPRDTKRIQQLYTKRSKQVEHLLHSATKQVIEFAKQEGVSKIILGDITHIRDEKSIGRINNQKFHKWPFGKIKKLLSYKVEDNGITIETQEESYTSQCSPNAGEVSQENASKGNRKNRGLYVDCDGKAYNADCVGAYNIMKKYLCRIGKPIPAVVGLDTPKAYRWNCYSFIGSTKLAISMAM